MSPKRKVKRRLKPKFTFLISDFIYVLGVFFISLGICGFISLTYEKNELQAKNENLTKVVSSSTMLNSYKEIDELLAEPVFYNNFYDAVSNAKKGATSFKGKLVHYGPDCKECSGRLGCNGQNALNGNIYYKDKEYGKVRIVATSSLIPCGSIIRINVSAYDPKGMYAIVLDRGVSGPMIDLLKSSQRSKSPVRTVNGVKFDIVRYGY